MRNTLHLNDTELFQLLDIIDFTINCILCDLNETTTKKKYVDMVKYNDILRNYGTIYNKIDNALNYRLEKEEKKKCRD